MKKFFAVILAVVFSGAALLKADGFDDAVAKAQALKKEGKYEEAAKVHPRSLCRAIYYWNAACQVVGHRDSNNDWAINASLSDNQKADGMRLLKLASDELEKSDVLRGSSVDSGDDGNCKGVDPDVLKDLIEKVSACIQGHCK